MSTFVLVPGAWLGGWCWKKITPILRRAGHEVYPVTLTGMGDKVHLARKEYGIEIPIQDVLNIIEYNDLDDIILVGHSFAGKVVAAVADRTHQRINTVLFLDAFRPQKVRTPQGSFIDEFPPSADGSNFPFTTAILDATPWLRKYAQDPVTVSTNFDSVRQAYIFCTGSGDPVDEILAGKWGKIEGPYKVIDSGHYPMITKPEELADDLLELTGKTLMIDAD
jgi:pimeloyl-ACP methyl ester carboxylesterase